VTADPTTQDGRTRALADGHRLPLLGLGVWQVPDGPECVDAIRWALEAGYRHLDTAQAYRNEASVGTALRQSGIAREDVFITTKFFPGAPDPVSAAEQSLQRLGVGYVDLYLIHWPQGGPIWAWPGMERARELGYARSIGQRAANQAAERALALAEADRLMLPFAMTGSRKLLESLPRHQTAHASLLTEILDLMHGSSVAARDQRPSPPAEELSPGELRVLRYLPSNLSRPQIASELSVSVNTVSTHIRSIYAKPGTEDRSAAVRRARELRLLSGVRVLAALLSGQRWSSVAAHRARSAGIPRARVPRPPPGPCVGW
jgi:DNA-binding CsgD family transcriptional regulator